MEDFDSLTKEEFKYYIQCEDGKIEYLAKLKGDCFFAFPETDETIEYEIKRLALARYETFSCELALSPLKGRSLRKFEELFKTKEPKTVDGYIPIKNFLPRERVKEQIDRTMAYLVAAKTFPSYEEYKMRLEKWNKNRHSTNRVS